ncbi:MAG TPA: hypothetical protein VGS10_13650 [Terracidiphilus sp.]|nr:hypothetical protein [Terracidiphilus sp.]
MSSQKRQPWPERFTERFHIFALGEKFDVDAFLSQSTLRSTCVWRQMGNGPTNGLELLLGDAQSLRLPEQEKIAIDYLKEHREELRALGNFPGVEALNLGFQYRAPSRAIGVCVGPSKGLMFHALEAGVRVNYYITLPRHRADS